MSTLTSPKGAQTMEEENGRLLTPEEVAERLRVTKKWVYAQARTGALPCVHVGRYVRFDVADIEAWIRNQRSEERS